jgi:hypothetical protein
MNKTDDKLFDTKITNEGIGNMPITGKMESRQVQESDVKSPVSRGSFISCKVILIIMGIVIAGFIICVILYKLLHKA